MISCILFVVISLILFQNFITNFTGIGIFGSFDELLVLSLFVISFFQIIRRKKINKFSLYILVIMLIFFTIGVYSFSKYTGKINILALKSGFLATKFWILIFALSNIKYNENIFNNIVNIIFVLEKIVLFIAALNLLMPNLYLKFFPTAVVSYRFGILSVSSLFLHPGKFGWFMLLCFIIRLSKNYNNSMNTNTKKKNFWMIIDLIFALLSFRTKVIIGFLAVFVAYELLFKAKNFISALKKIYPIIIFVLVIGFVFKGVLFETYNLYFTDKYGVSARQSLNETSLKIAKDKFPFGVGFGKYASWYSIIEYSDVYYAYSINDVYGLTPDDPWYATDVFWPAIIGETGFLGLSIFIIMLLCVLKKLFIYIKKYKNKCNIFLQLTAFLLLIQTIIESFGEASFNSSPQNIFVGLFVGVAISNISQMKGESL